MGVEGVEEQTAPEEVPASNTDTTDETRPVSDEVEVDESGQETDDVATEGSDDPKQREAFIKMRQKIKELEDKLDTQEDDFDLVSLARGITDPQPQSDDGVEMDMSDAATRHFMNRVANAEAIAKAAERKALARIEDMEAWQEYPFLKPEATRTPEQKLFLEDVKNAYIKASLDARVGGKTPKTLVQVAREVEKRHELLRASGLEKATSKAQQVKAQKEAATLESKGTTTNVAPSTDEEHRAELRRRVNMGDIQALAELNSLEDPYISGIE